MSSQAGRLSAIPGRRVRPSKFSFTSSVANAAELRLAADKEMASIKQLHTKLDDINRRIRVLKCRSVGGKSRKVRLLCACDLHC